MRLHIARTASASRGGVLGEFKTPRCVSNAVELSSSSNDVPPVSLGIDLGTTNSVAAVVTAEYGPSLVRCSEDSDDWTLPSVVTFKKNGDVVVGEEAKRQAAVFPDTTFYSVKRIIGKEYKDVKKDCEQLAYKVGPDEDGVAQIVCSNSEEGSLYPEEVSAHVLLRLINAVHKETGCLVDRAVISVPAYFDESQRESTIAAGKIAGLEHVRLIKEPVASAFSYGLDLNEDQTVLVFDLGGGTFDVSILEVGNGVIEVLSTGGDSYLGGDDWDAAIMDFLEKEYLKPYGIDANEPTIRTNLRGMAEQAKIALSSAQQVKLTIPVGGEQGTGSEVVITQQLLDQLSVELFRRCRRPVDQACWQAGVDLGTVVEQHEKDMQRYNSKKASQRGDKPSIQIVPKRRQPISEVLLVGGATRMPAIRRFVTNMTGLNPRPEIVDPDAAVASGAAVYAGVLSGHIEDLMVLDVWQAALMRAYAKRELKNNSAAREALFGTEDDGTDTGSDMGDDSFDEEFSDMEEEVVKM